MTAIRIAQLSDTHFLGEGESAEGGFAYNTDDAFDAVRRAMATHDPFDMVVVTGDIADHGRAGQYKKAAAAFAQLDAPVNVCIGNHDQQSVFAACMARPTIGTSRVVELGPWCFLFADSSAGVLQPDATGRMVDPDVYEDRLHGNGSLGEQESAWIRDMCANTPAEHIFIWLHHPPATPVGLCRDDAYTKEWQTLLADLPKVRGMGGGHTHVPDEYVFASRPIFVCPSFKNNFDLEAETLLPPGFRSYEFHPDGSVTGQAHVCDDDRWPRHPLGRAVMGLMRGELSWEEFDTIVTRRNAKRSTNPS